MDWMQDKTSELETKQLLQLIKVCLQNSWKLSTKAKLNERFKWKWKILPKYLLIKYNSITFQSWWLPSYNLTQEHCKLIIFYLTSTSSTNLHLQMYYRVSYDWFWAWKSTIKMFSEFFEFLPILNSGEL